MLSPTLIVAEDSEIALKRLKEHKTFYHSIDIDIEWSRTITFDGDDGDSTIDYEKLQSYLGSRNAPENLILILDLAYAGDEKFAKSLIDENLEYKDIELNQVAGTNLGSIAINNAAIKNLMIFYATTRDNRYASFLHLEKECAKASDRLGVNRKFTNYGGCNAFVLSKGTPAENRLHTKNYLDNVVKQWKEWTSEVILGSDTSTEKIEEFVSLKDLEFRLRFEGALGTAQSIIKTKGVVNLSTVNLFLDSRLEGETSWKKTNTQISLDWVKSFFYDISENNFFLSNKKICDKFIKNDMDHSEDEKVRLVLDKIFKYLAKKYDAELVKRYGSERYKFAGRGTSFIERKRKVVKIDENGTGVILVAKSDRSRLD